MTSTNYLSPENFVKMVDAIPLVTEYNKSQVINDKRVPNARLLQAALYVQYCHALRVSEVLTLESRHFNFERNILTLEKTKTGFKKKDGLKVRKKQYTSIPPDLPKWVGDWIKQFGEGLLFPFTRQLIWSYVKKAAKLADLDLAEQQDERLIEGAWTHLIRKSRAKLMIDLGAREVLVKVKLRHAFTTTERYTKPDINALIDWERETITNG